MRRYTRIISGFQKTLDQLDRLIASNEAEVTKKSDKVHKLCDEMNALDAESRAANRTRESIRSLLG